MVTVLCTYFLLFVFVFLHLLVFSDQWKQRLPYQCMWIAAIISDLMRPHSLCDHCDGECNWMNCCLYTQISICFDPFPPARIPLKQHIIHLNIPYHKVEDESVVLPLISHQHDSSQIWLCTLQIPFTSMLELIHESN
eukprot:145745_1